MSFWVELKRRNVFKVGAAYVIVAWLLVQVASVYAPALNLPGWVTGFVAFVSIIGLPIALFLAWAYELTPTGIQRTRDVPMAESVRQMTGQKLNYVVTGLLAVAVVYLLADDYLAGRGAAEPATSASSSAASDAASAGAAEPPDSAVGRLPNSVAVLPFANLSPNDEDAYFALGLHEEVLNQLVKLSSLNVISRTTMMQYVDGSKTPREVASELNVETVMEGSVRYAGDAVRVTVQLIDPITDTHLWSQEYNADLSDIANLFAIQANIATNVAGALEGRLSLQEQSRIGSVPTESVEAYGYYLAARAAGAVGTPAGSAFVIEQLERAVEIDPRFALGWARLAYQQAIEPTWRPDRTDELTDAATEHALRAIELEPTLPEAHIAMSFVSTVRGEWLRSEREYRRALELGANSAELPERSVLELAVGHLSPARATLERNQIVNPLNDVGLAFLIAASEALGDTQAVSERYALGRSVATTWPWGEYLMNFVRLGRGDIRALANDTISVPPFHAELGGRATAAAGLAALGEWFGELEDPDPNDYLILAAWAAHYGDADLAMNGLRRTTASRQQNIWFAWLPLFDDVRRTPGFVDLVGDLGLVDYWREHGWPDFCRPLPGGALECD